MFVHEQERMREGNRVDKGALSAGRPDAFRKRKVGGGLDLSTLHADGVGWRVEPVARHTSAASQSASHTVTKHGSVFETKGKQTLRQPTPVASHSPSADRWFVHRRTLILPLHLRPCRPDVRSISSSPLCSGRTLFQVSLNFIHLICLRIVSFTLQTTFLFTFQSPL